jgi:hypothetical protein
MKFLLPRIAPTAPQPAVIQTPSSLIDEPGVNKASGQKNFDETPMKQASPLR